MPKCQNGTLIKCEKSMKIFIEYLNKSRNFIIQNLDDEFLLVKDNEVSYLLDEVSKMQDKNTYIPIQIL